jgi:hypothetical protein
MVTKTNSYNDKMHLYFKSERNSYKFGASFDP